MKTIRNYILYFMFILFFLSSSCDNNIKDNLDSDSYSQIQLTHISIPDNGASSISPSTGNIQIVFNKSMQPDVLPSVYLSIDNIVNPQMVSSLEWSTTAIMNDTLEINIAWNRLPENTTIKWNISANQLVDMYGNPEQNNMLFGTFTTGLSKPVTYSDSTLTVSDSSTGLVWKKCIEGLSGADCSTGIASELIRADAATACSDLNGTSYGGISTWRLPSVEELITLNNYSAMNPSVYEQYFPNTPYFSKTTTPPIAGFWTSTDDAESAPNTYSIHVTTNFGYVWYRDVTTPDFTRCVSGPPISKFNLTDNSDGSISDSNTGLVWQKCNQGQSYDTGSCTGTAELKTWYDGLQYCQDLQLAGRDDWRLPTIDEILTIVDYSAWGPSTSSLFNVPPDNSPFIYYTSTTAVEENIRAWEVQFRCGYTGYGGGSGTMKADADRYIRCVAGP